MSGYVRTICATLLAALLTACASTPSQTSTSEVGPASSGFGRVGPLVDTDCTHLTFSGEVSSAFNPAAQTGAPPAAASSIPQTTLKNMKDSIIAACKIAPVYFRGELVGLKGIYVTSTADSWGYRDTASGTTGTPPKYNTYIALSKDLWDAQGTPAQRLHEYAYDTLISLFPQLDTPSPQVSYAPAVYSGTANDQLMTILAVMAHEVGHLEWLKLFVPAQGQNPDFGDFSTRCQDLFTRMRMFPREFWRAQPLALRWQTFGVIDDYPAKFDDEVAPGTDEPPPENVRIEKLQERLDRAVETGDYSKALRLMERILSKTHPWPSLFGAFSVNEQFVESFTLYTLLNGTPGLMSLQLSIPVGPARLRKPDIPATWTARPELKKMLDCLARYYSVP